MHTQPAMAAVGSLLLLATACGGSDPDQDSGEVAGAIEQAFEGTVYGIATFGNAQGFVYNKRILEQAGVTDWPTTPDEFLADLQLVQQNTDAIPYYTNYAAGWPLVQWENHRGSISADPEYVNKLAHTAQPWAPGTDHYVIDSLLYDTVASGLVEEDPTTTDWEASKGLLGRGEIASMSLGSDRGAAVLIRYRLQRRATPYLFLAAGLLLLAVFTYIPVANLFHYSLLDWDGLSPDRELVGLDNYLEVFTRPELFGVFRVSLYYLGGTFVQIAAALYFATILSSPPG